MLKWSSFLAGCALIKLLKLGDRFRHEIESILVVGQFCLDWLCTIFEFGKKLRIHASIYIQLSFKVYNRLISEPENLGIFWGEPEPITILPLLTPSLPLPKDLFKIPSMVDEIICQTSQYKMWSQWDTTKIKYCLNYLEAKYHLLRSIIFRSIWTMSGRLSTGLLLL